MPGPIIIQQKRRNKYGVGSKERRTVDGIVFASIWESEAYTMLKMLLGREHFELQPEFILQEGFTHEGKKYRPIKYVGDFLLRAKSGDIVVDTKGHETQEFKMKAKMFVYTYRETIQLVKRKSELLELLKSLQKQGELKLKMM